jgi:hypothetical protein
LSDWLARQGAVALSGVATAEAGAKG